MDTLESRTIVTEQSILEYTDYRCPSCNEDLRGCPTQRVNASEDSWYYRIRCRCGKVIEAIND